MSDSQDSEDEAIQLVDDMFKGCVVRYKESYPGSTLDFERLNLNGRLEQGHLVSTEGRFSDVYKGRLDRDVIVAVKLLRLPEYCEYNHRLYQNAVVRFVRELHAWHKLSHVNTVSMLGYTLARGRIGLVSHWRQNGTLVQYLKNRPNANKPDLILDVAEGTQYLHTCSPPVIHGDLKGVNVLISELGIAQLADFGLSRSMEDINRQTGFTTTGAAKGTSSWMAPELFKDSPMTLSSDIYSCAGVFLEICCPGKRPYDYLNCFDVSRIKECGDPPERLNYDEMARMDSLWQLMSLCWAHDPCLRPRICEVVADLYMRFRLQPRISSDRALRPLVVCGLCEPKADLSSTMDDHLDCRIPISCSSHKLDGTHWILPKPALFRSAPPPSTMVMSAVLSFLEAQGTYKGLVQKYQGKLSQDIATSLSHLSVDLGNIGKHSGALQLSHGALEIYRALAQEDPARFNPDLANSLSSLSIDLSNIGRHREARCLSQEALEIYRALALENPDRFNPDLANALSDLSVDLSNIGRDTDALQLSQEGLKIHRALAQKCPSRFNPDLATTLSNLSTYLSNLGKDMEALQLCQEARYLHRYLAQLNPLKVNPGLATCLSNLSIYLSNLGRDREALKHSRQALRVHRALAQELPARFNPGLATSLFNLSIDLGNIGKDRKALQFSKEALEIRRALASEHPAKFNPDLVASLSGLSVCLYGLGRDTEALQFHQEAEGILRADELEHPITLT